MNFSNPYSRDLGVFTWSALQSAYANGGGALAALPAGARAFVSDWGVTFTPNAAKTAWRPDGGKFMLSQGNGSLASPLASITGVVVITKFGITSIQVPANLTYAQVRIECKAEFRKVGSNAAWLWQWKLGTGDTSSDSTFFDGSNNANATDTRIDSRALIVSATAAVMIGRSSANASSGGNIAVDRSGGTLDATALQYMNFYITPTSVSDSFSLVGYQFTLEYPL